VVYLLATGHDATPFLLALATLVPMIGTLFQITKVEKQTNGANTKLLNENQLLRTHLGPEATAKALATVGLPTPAPPVVTTPDTPTI
jgi:hypothetical protein